jgi:hypothetical protein
MLHFHVTKEVFEKIKDGRKRSEFRPANDYYTKNLLRKYLKDYLNDKIVLGRFYLAYPKKTQKEKIIDVVVNCVSWVSPGHRNLDPLVYQYYKDQTFGFYQVDFEVV